MNKSNNKLYNMVNIIIINLKLVLKIIIFYYFEKEDVAFDSYILINFEK